MESKVAVLLAATLVGIAGAHDWSFGRCPSVTPMKNFDVSKFLDLWYVIELFDSTSTCQTLSYSRVSETQLNVTKERQFVILDTMNIAHINTYTGKLDIPDGDNAAQMRVKWPLNVAGKADYVVVDTDYDGYASIYECQPLTRFANRMSAAILSRSPTLDASRVNTLKKQLQSAGVDISHFDKIDHSVCTQRSDADYNIDVDDSTITKLIDSAGNGIKNVASTVVNGAESFADTVVDITRRISSATDGVAGANDASAPLVDYSDVEIIS